MNNINASTDKEYAIAEAAVYNQYMDVNMQYTGDGVPFASVEAQPYLEYEYSYGDTHYEYYEVEPVMYLHPIIRDTVSKSISMKPISVMYFKV